MSREQCSQLLFLERSQHEPDLGAGAPDALGELAHALSRQGLFRAIRDEQQQSSVVDVVS